MIRNKEREGTKQPVFGCMMTEPRLAGPPGGLGKDRADHINNNKLYLHRDLWLRRASHYDIAQNRRKGASPWLLSQGFPSLLLGAMDGVITAITDVTSPGWGN